MVKITKVKRSLFQVDHTLTQEDMNKENNEILLEKSHKWNFDFKNNIPLSNNGDLKWIRCDSENYGVLNTRFDDMNRLGYLSTHSKQKNKNKQNPKRKTTQSTITGKLFFRK